MQFFMVVALVVPGAVSAKEALRGTSAITPVQKVLQMMNGMKAKSLAEKNEEMVTFKTFTQFCMDTNSAKLESISNSVDQIEKLKADMGKANADARELGKEIEKLDALAAKGKADKAKNTADFEMEKADYQKMHAEYDLNIADTETAIGQVKTMMMAENMVGKGQKADAAESFIQTLVSKPSFPMHAKRVLVAFLATSSTVELQRLGEPEGNTYESQSGGVIDLMTELAEKFAQQKAKLEREFVKTQGAFQVMQQTFSDLIDQHTTMRNLKAGTMKGKEAEAATADGDIASTKNMMAEDKTYLKDVNAECGSKSADYEARQKLRAGEIEALNKAIEILSGGAVSGAADKHLPSLVQGGALSQLRSSLATEKRPSQFVAASFLQAQGRTINSRILATLALRVKEDPFAKVKKMIQDMVTKLMEEATEEAEHKGFCDTEMGTNKMTREQKATEIEELTADIDELISQMGQLGGEIGDLSERLAETDAAILKATSIRTEEKTKNSQTISDASGAKEAVGKALDVLRSYYESAAEGAAFIQEQLHSSTGVIGMLEVILSDFERLEADTKQSEKVNQMEFEKFLNESNQEKAIAEQQKRNKEESRTEADVSLGKAKRDLASSQEELEAAETYFEKLKPSCVQEEVSYDDRVQRRKEEIESLKEALKILDEQPIA